MPLDVTSLSQDPYAVKVPPPPGVVDAPGPAGHTGPVRYRGEHIIYPMSSGRIKHTLSPPPVGDARRRIGGRQDASGDAFFLQFYNEKITSIRLPVPAPAAVEFFVTDNMTGCKFYVDSIAGSSDVIVYHANTTQHGGDVKTDADFQEPDAIQILDDLHDSAQGDYRGLGLTLTSVAECAKPTYFQTAGLAERRARLEGKEGVEFAGGSTIVGFPGAAGWEFWYQTWGDVGYSARSAKAVTKALFTFRWSRLHDLNEHKPDYSTMSVIDCKKIYPVP